MMRLLKSILTIVTNTAKARNADVDILTVINNSNT